LPTASVGVLLEWVGHSCAMERAPHQPFLLTAWRAIAALTADVDFSLANIFSAQET